MLNINKDATIIKPIKRIVPLVTDNSRFNIMGVVVTDQEFFCIK